MPRARGTTRVLAAIGCSLAAGVALAAPASAAADNAGGQPATGERSNLGLCSPYLAGLDAPVDPFTGEVLGGNARSGVNLLIKILGPMLPDHLDTPGELYRVRAQEHPTGPAESECLPRPAP